MKADLRNFFRNHELTILFGSAILLGVLAFWVLAPSVMPAMIGLVAPEVQVHLWDSPLPSQWGEFLFLALILPGLVVAISRNLHILILVGLCLLLLVAGVIAAWVLVGAFVELGIPGGLALGGTILFVLIALFLLRRRG